MSPDLFMLSDCARAAPEARAAKASAPRVRVRVVMAVSEARNDPLDDAHELFSSSDAEAAEARRDLGQLLQTLPDRQRLPIVHVKLHGLSVVETAQLTGLSESAVKIGVHRGLKALAAKIRGMA